jgi:hypothetical protein
MQAECFEVPQTAVIEQHREQPFGTRHRPQFEVAKTVLKQKAIGAARKASFLANVEPSECLARRHRLRAGMALL